MMGTNMDSGDTVEQIQEYQPEHLGETQFRAGDPEQVWERYAIELVPVEVNVGGDFRSTERLAIMRNGEFLEMVSDDYKLVPNEEVVHAGNEIADRLGAVPFDEFGGDWFVRLDDHVFMDSEARRSHALYAWDDPVDLGYGDEVQIGFALHNSIDRSMGLQVGLFTFRHACANMVTMAVNGEGMNFDQRDVLKHSSRKHTHGLEMDNLRAWIEEVVSFGPAVLDTYRDWQNERLSIHDAARLSALVEQSRLSRRNDVPGWLKDATETVEEQREKAEENEQLGEIQFVEGLPHDVIEEIMAAHIPPGETRWDTYNDVTREVWHSGKTNDRSKMRKFKNLHRVLQPAAGVQ